MFNTRDTDTGAPWRDLRDPSASRHAISMRGDRGRWCCVRLRPAASESCRRSRSGCWGESSVGWRTSSERAAALAWGEVPAAAGWEATAIKLKAAQPVDVSLVGPTLVRCQSTPRRNLFPRSLSQPIQRILNPSGKHTNQQPPECAVAGNPGSSTHYNPFVLHTGILKIQATLRFNCLFLPQHGAMRLL